MNIDFEVALKYIDLGSYDKAIEKLNSAISKEEEGGKADLATQYRCVLGELYAKLGDTKNARTEFYKVIDYCDDTNTLQKQRTIAKTYINVFDGIIKAPEQPEAKRPGDAPLVPKPVQNKSFIAKQTRKNHR